MKNVWIIILMFLSIINCQKPLEIEVIVENPIAVDRIHETIEISDFEIDEITPDLQVMNAKGNIIPSQKIDRDGNGEMDQLIFQTDLAANETQKFKLVIAKNTTFKSKTFALFVPERENDFAWENDKIAFRMYNKSLQIKENVNNGVDVWTKKVSNLILNKWYKGRDYHRDHGEGLDFYHVGNSRGCGGLAILHNEKMYGFGGYVTWKIITNGPIRTTFELTYDSIIINGNKYSEVKRVYIDAGWNVSRYESMIKCDEDIKLAIGLSIHANQGEGSVINNKEKGFISFWEPATKGNGNIGTGIILEKEKFLKAKEIEKHHSIISFCKPDEKIVYYSGAGWDKSSDFSDKESWDKYLVNIADRINNPVKINIKK